MKLIRNSSEGSKTGQRKNYIELTPGMPVWVQHRQNTSWEPATVVSQCNSNSYWIMQENGTDQLKVYRRTRTMLKIRCTDVRQTRHVQYILYQTQCLFLKRIGSFMNGKIPVVIFRMRKSFMAWR